MLTRFAESKLPILRLGLARTARVLAGIIRTKAFVGAKALRALSAESVPEERLPAVFQPEVLLPVQYYEALRRKRLLQAEKLLMLAVLEDAVTDYMKYVNSTKRRGQRLFREAEDWINRDDALWLFSFSNVCESLEIDPEYMRRGLHRWKQAHRETAEHAGAP